MPENNRKDGSSLLLISFRNTAEQKKQIAAEKLQNSTPTLNSNPA